MPLREQIEAIALRRDGNYSPADRAVFEEFKSALNRGDIRAAERNVDGVWLVHSWVKQGILLGFRMGALTDMSEGNSFRFFDKHTYPVRPTEIGERSEEHTSELQSRRDLVCRLLLEKKKN